MNAKTTWIWITLAAILFAAAVAVEKYGRPAPAQLVALLPGFRAAEITAVQFTPAGQMDLRVERTNDAWQLVKPIQYPAQGNSVEVLLQALERQAPAHIITGAELLQHQNADAEFGFNARNTLTLVAGTQTRQLLLGQRTAPGDQLYVRVIGVEGVFVVDANLLRLLPARVDDWRDTALVDLRRATFDRLAISNAAATLELQRDAISGLWRLTAPLPARANHPRVQDALQKLQTTRVQAFVAEDATAEAEIYGFGKPELVLTLAAGTNQLATLQFGATPATNSTLIYARRLGSPTIVTVERQPLEPWLAPVNAFRDPQLIAPRRAVEVIEVRGRESFVLQRSATNAWRLVGSELPVDAEAVGEFLLTLVTAPIVQYRDSITEADLPKFGLQPPGRQVVLRAGTTNGTSTNIIAELAFGDIKDDLGYVRRADENPVYGIGITDFARLAIAPWQLRQRQLWRFDGADVVRVQMERAEHRVELRRAGTNTWVFAPGSQGLLRAGSGAVEETVVRFGDLRALAWVGRGAEDRIQFGFGPNTLKLTLELKDGQQHAVEFGGMSLDNYPYAAVERDGESWIFEFPIALHQLTFFALPIPGAQP